LRLHRGNQDLEDANHNFQLAWWEADIDAATAGVDPRPYLRDGTLVGVYAIDEPFADFSGNMSGDMLEDMCQYLKSKQYWGSVPCLIRDLNTTLTQADHLPHTPDGKYQYVDAGWAQIADHQYVTIYNGSMQAYFKANLDAGAPRNLALVYGFNLINGGREFTGCAKPGVPPAAAHNCAMTPAEVREAADAIKALPEDQGCGVNGWRIDPNPGAELDYYNRADVQSALQYMHTTLATVRPMQVCSYHNLPVP
jgi:hypothetical protein